MSDNKDVIQNRMLENIPSEYDKSEGSFFYDVLKPVAIELETAYQEQEDILNKGFVETSTSDYLDKKVSEQGITRKPSTKATTNVRIAGSQGAVINIGDKVASDTVNFIFTESKTIDSSGFVDVTVECETSGTIGNVPIGAIKYFPVTLAGLNSVTNLTAVINGYDGETDEELRQRYFEKVRTPATSGNKYHYRNWAKEVTGVGDARIFPLWNGNGTVKVVILNSNKRGADQTLIDSVAEYIEENRPIGATVTVQGAVELSINVSVSVVIDENNYTLNGIKSAIESSLINHFKDIAFENTYISYANIGNIIFNTPGVLDYSNLLVNGGTANISIEDDEVGVLGGVTVA